METLQNLHREARRGPRPQGIRSEPRAWIQGVRDLPGNKIPPTVSDEREHEDIITMMNPSSQ
eukprot:7483454-Heterocapsa_arctica.AAC.1